MKKNILIPVIVLVLLLLGVGGYLFMNKQSTRPSGIENDVVSSNNSKGDLSTLQKASLKNLMGMKNQECTFSDKESGSEGVMRVSSGKMRGDFTSKSEGQTLTTHMISDGKDVYIWMDELQSAMKISLAAMEDVNSKALANAPKTVDFNREVEYGCKSWSPDNSLFQIPTDRTFTDMSAMMKGAAEMMKDIKTPSTEGTVSSEDKASACAVCDQAPAGAKEQCRAALGC